MAGSIFDNIDPTITSGTQLATLLNNLKDAFSSGIKGDTRPTNLMPGGCWIDDTDEDSPTYKWYVKLYDGSQDITLMTVNISTNTVYVAGSSDEFTITRTGVDDATGAKLILKKKRSSTNGQVASGDVIGLLEARSTDQVGTEISEATLIQSVATETHTTTGHGTKLEMYIKKIGATAKTLMATINDYGFMAANFIDGYSTTPTAAGTTILTVASNRRQFFTGSTTQTVQLPVASTLTLGMSFEIVNNSTGLVTINSSGGNAVQVMAANTRAEVVCILASGTSAASWHVRYSPYASTSRNVYSNNFVTDYTTTATAAGTTVLTVGSTYFQFFTGATTQTITLPVASTLTTGHSFLIVNNSTGALTVNSSGGNLVQTIQAAASARITCILASGTSAASWDSRYSPTELAANFNEKLNKVKTITSVTASGGTTTMTNASEVIYITGSSAQTVTLPDTTTCYIGQEFRIINWTSGYKITVNSFSGSLWDTIQYDTVATFVVVSTGVTNGFRTLYSPATFDYTVKTLELANGRIFFPATQNPSTGANTLDDYEEGTFTPTYYGSSTAGTTTYVTQNGWYVKIGMIVYFSMRVQWSNATGTGACRFGGLPFTSANDGVGNAGYTTIYLDNFTLGANLYVTGGYVIPNETNITLYSHIVGGGAVNNIGIDAAATVVMSGFYRTV